MILSHNIFGVVGKPILHSKSPDIFKYISKKYNLFDCSYIRIIADSAKEIVEIMKSLNIHGLNIAYPFKKDILNYIDEKSQESNLISSANVIINRDSKLIGYNTDYIGVINTLKKNNIDTKGKKCLVIGCGGAGRAAVYGLMQLDSNVKIINRTNDTAKDFASKMKCEFAKWDFLEDEIKHADLIINTVPSKDLMIDEYISKEQYVIQADYTKSSDKFSDKSITGTQWLINQALPSVNYFMGLNLIDDNTISELLSTLIETTHTGVQKKENISLIGFIGSGKTSIGKLLADKLKWEFFDTDEMIVQKVNIPIKEIFKKYGENYFRNLEKEVLLSLKDKKNMILSCGGGLILNQENRALLTKISNIFWVFSPLNVCMERLKSELRPPLTNPFESITDPLEKSEILFNARIPYYCDAADALLYNNDLLSVSVNKIYDEVHTFFGN